MNDVQHIQEALKCSLATATKIEEVMYDFLNPPDYSESSLYRLKSDFLMVAKLANIKVN